MYSVKVSAATKICQKLHPNYVKVNCHDPSGHGNVYQSHLLLFQLKSLHIIIGTNETDG